MKKRIPTGTNYLGSITFEREDRAMTVVVCTRYMRDHPDEWKPKVMEVVDHLVNLEKRRIEVTNESMVKHRLNSAAQDLQDALAVFMTDKKIARLLVDADPMAVKQALAALQKSGMSLEAANV